MNTTNSAKHQTLGLMIILAHSYKNKHYTAEFKDFSLKSQLYDLDVLGYKGNKNKLHLFDIASVDESMVHDGISFDKSNIVRNLTFIPLSR